MFILVFGLIDIGSNICAYSQNLPTATISSIPEFKDFEWNRYVQGDIVILSINNEQGKWLNENIDNIRSWCLTRWGFPNFKFSKECRIFCVPNKELLKKMFNLDRPKVELREDMTVIWFVMDDPVKTLPPLLTQVCLAEFEIKHNVKIGFWFKCGASQLNSTVFDIRGTLTGLKDQPVFGSEKMFTMTEEDYLKESVENKKIFDQEAIALCIMLRKEFGEAKLQGFLRIASANNPNDVLKVVYGFDGYDHFDKQYFRFMRELVSDMLNNKTPDSYLEIKPVR